MPGPRVREGIEVLLEFGHLERVDFAKFWDLKLQSRQRAGRRHRDRPRDNGDGTRVLPPSPGRQVGRVVLPAPDREAVLCGDVRDVLSALRPRILDEHGLEHAARWLCQRVSETYGIACTLAVEGADERASQLLSTFWNRQVKPWLPAFADAVSAHADHPVLDAAAETLRVLVAHGPAEGTGVVMEGATHES